MKKKIFIFAALLLAMFAQAKNKTIIIKGTRPLTGATEVEVDNSGLADTLTVTPAKDASVITVVLKGLNGQDLQRYVVAATCDDLLNIISSELPEGYMLEIRDDKGTVYTELDNE